MRKLTIGMSVYDDYDGVYFSIQSLRLSHPEILDQIEFVIVNNNPKSKHGEAVHSFKNWIKEPVQYLEFSGYSSTAVRNKVFDIAETDYVLCMDSHVLIEPGALKKLIEFYDSGKDEGCLLQGPLLYDDLSSVSTHFNLIWRNFMYGIWGTDPRGVDPTNEPFEIPAQGLGLFTCRKKDWLGFSPHFRGFGGEEGYIHEKFRNAGKKTLCLPFLRWVHRFERPNGVPYTLDLRDRFRNYMIGFNEVYKDTSPVLDHFKGTIQPEYIKQVKRELNIS